MATYNLPSTSGWQGSTYLALRLYVVQTYDAQQNRSTLTVKLQGRYPGTNAYNDSFSIGATYGTSGTLKCNGSTILQFPSNTSYRVAANTDNVWRDMTYNDTAWSHTVAVNHNADGSASVSFVLDAYAQSLYGGQSFNTSFANKTATLNLSETPQTGGTVWVYDGGAWVECKPYVYDGGWKECEAYIYDNGWVKA